MSTTLMQIGIKAKAEQIYLKISRTLSQVDALESLLSVEMYKLIDY